MMAPHEVDWVRVGREQGRTWDQIVVDLNLGPLTGDQLRKRYARAKAVTTADERTVCRSWPTSFNLEGNVKLLLLPDTQVAAGVPLEHFRAAGRYAAAKEVTGVVHIGDFVDYGAISTYHTPRSKEGARLKDDVDSAVAALQLFKDGLDGYTPQLQVLTLGNHEDRLKRYIDEHPELEGTLTLPPFEQYNWMVYPFLQPVCINGVYFAHYFTRSAKGWAGKNPHPNAQVMTRREMVSCVAGHSPGFDTYIHPAGGGAGLIRGTIAGSFYQHDETYQGPQGNRYWRGCLVLTEVANGYYNLVEVSMNYLLEHYGD